MMNQLAREGIGRSSLFTQFVVLKNIWEKCHNFTCLKNVIKYQEMNGNDEFYTQIFTLYL